MKKMYQKNLNDDICHDIDHWREYMLDNKLKTLTLLEMEKHTETDLRYCSYFGDFIGKGDCGKQVCNKYEPVNGKRGICKHKDYTYTHNGKTIELKEK
jgi:hypothetical protein